MGLQTQLATVILLFPLEEIEIPVHKFWFFVKKKLVSTMLEVDIFKFTTPQFHWRVIFHLLGGYFCFDSFCSPLRSSPGQVDVFPGSSLKILHVRGSVMIFALP